MEYDVIVCGAGPAGLAAALEADRQGARTLLIERDGMVGGMATQGMLNVFCGDAPSALYGEIFAKLVRRMAHRKAFDIEELKAFFLDKLAASGVKTLLHAAVLDAQVGGGRVTGLRTLENGGIGSHAGKIYIDCTGNGDLAAACGVPFTLGRETDGAMQPVTVYIRLGGVDAETFLKLERSDLDALQRELTAAGERGEIDPAACALRLIPEKRDGYLNLNMTNATGVDGTDSEALTAAEFRCRGQIPSLLAFIRARVPGCENAYVIQTGAYAGIRESRHFAADYIVTENDLADGRVFDDWCVANAQNSFNVHNMTGAGGDVTGRSCAARYTLPYRSLCAEGFDNLLLAGRCIGGTHMAHSSYRVIPICMAMGQAAGTAAALAAADGCAVSDIDTGRMQSILISRGVTPPGAQIGR